MGAVPEAGSSARPPISEEAVARDYYPRVRFIVAKRLGAGHPDLDDLVQDIMTATVIAIRRGTVQDPDKLAAYVHGIIRNVIAEALRRKYRQRDLDAAALEGAESAGATASPTVSPLERLFVREALDQLAEGIRRLGSKQRQVFQLLLVREEEVSVVARTLGLEPARVREAKHYAIKNLREHLKSCGIEPRDILCRSEVSIPRRPGAPAVAEQHPPGDPGGEISS